MSREEIILRYVRDKDILDIGSTGQTEAYDLFALTRNEAAQIVGIDTTPSSDPAIVCGDMETHSFGKQFDVILAGDVLEHVDNQGLFLQNVHRHLKSEGVFILTTPNAKWFTVALKPNPTHTLWHDRYTLTHLLQRHQFQIDYFQYYYGNKPYYNPLFRLLTLRQAMLVVCRKSPVPETGP